MKIDWKRILIGRWDWKRPFKSILAIYLLLAIVAVFFTDKILFAPPVPTYQADDKDLIWLKTGDGETICAHYDAATPGMPTLLFSHGNAEDIGQAVDLYQTWHAMGLGVLAYDYPGYVCSSGKTTEASCQRAILTAWDYLVRSGVQASSIIIVGRSVGGGPSVWLAEQMKPAGLVLISPFKSVYSVPFGAPIFPCDRFPNLKRIRGMTTPLVVFHGDQDEVIPFAHGRSIVSASAASDKTFHPIHGAGHNDLFEIAGDDIVQQIAEFSRRIMK